MRVDPLDLASSPKLAGYLVKYLLKDVSGVGSLDHRLREGEIDELDLPDHLRTIVETAWRLGALPGQARLRRWAHALGYTGHLLTKSRRYSTTFKALHAARLAWRLDYHEQAEQHVAEQLSSSFEGAGYRHEIDAMLAASYAKSSLEARREAALERYGVWVPADRRAVA